jgi:hypothetical protein
MIQMNPAPGNLPAQKEQHANCLMLHLRESPAEGTAQE